MTFGEFLREERRKHKWSLKQLGERLTGPRWEKGVSAQYLNDIEMERRIPSDELLTELARVLELPVSDLRARCEKGSADVAAYLAENPEESQEVGRLFRRAREKGFSDWKRLRDVIDGKARK